MRISTACHAKVNLSLSVGPVDPVGYHPISTVFQTVSLCDDLVLEPSSTGEDSLVCDWPGMPVENTLTKCLRLVRELHPVPPVLITLTKRIPAQSGLGGGSSDAAGLIRCLRSVFRDYTQHQAFETAVAIGADVPFFLVGGRALGRGYGQALTPVPYTDTEHLVVVVPPVPVSTAGAYRALDELPLKLLENPPLGTNDFERVAPAECHRTIGALRELGGNPSMLSGSGCAVFGVFQSQEAAESAGAAMIEADAGLVFVCRTTSREESICVTS